MCSVNNSIEKYVNLLEVWSGWIFLEKTFFYFLIDFDVIFYKSDIFFTADFVCLPNITQTNQIKPNITKVNLTYRGGWENIAVKKMSDL